MDESKDKIASQPAAAPGEPVALSDEMIAQPAAPAAQCTCKGVLGHTRSCAMFDESMMRYEPFSPSTAAHAGASAQWKALPPKLTPEMKAAMVKAAREYMERTGGNSPEAMYEAAFAAAPTPVADSGASERIAQLEQLVRDLRSAQAVKVIPQGVMGMPPIGTASVTCAPGISFNAAAKPVSVDAGGMTALRNLRDVLRVRHHGRMPEEVQRAYDAACALLDAESTGSTGEPTL